MIEGILSPPPLLALFSFFSKSRGMKNGYEGREREGGRYKREGK